MKNTESTRDFHLFMGGVVSLLIALDWSVGRLVNLAPPGPVHDCIFALLLLLAIVMYCHRRNFPRLREVGAMVIWTVMLIATLNILVTIAGTSPAPLVDRQLASVDAAIHCSALAVVSWLRSFPVLRNALELAYGSLPPLILAAIVVPCLCGRYRQSQRYMVGVTIAAIVTVALFALWPAVGPWVVYGYSPAHDQAATQAFLLALKAHQPTPKDGVAAIVSFPSFHVELALLTGAALWAHRWARPLLVLLTTAICVSTVTTGWHYVIDVLGGLVVTGAAYYLAFLVDRALNRGPAPHPMPMLLSYLPTPVCLNRKKVHPRFREADSISERLPGPWVGGCK